jgi:sugar phosphate isomerase/epimerase
MIRINTDQKAIDLIMQYYQGLFETKDERDEILDALEDYQIGISNILTQSKTLLNPEEALRIARENNKPILL